MINGMTTLINVNVAGEPTFYPHADPKHHKCEVTAIKNLGKNKQTGVEMKQTYNLTFWGGYAQKAALYLDKGRCICLKGEPMNYAVPTGRIKDNGKKEFNTKNTTKVEGFEFGPMSKKEMIDLVSTNMAMIQAAIDAGTRSPQKVATAEELVAVHPITAYDYSPELAALTGRYGNARVWTKEGWMGASAAPVGVVADDAQIAKMEAELARIKAAKVAAEAAVPAAAAANASVDPFPQP